jgi:predicted permease
MRHLAADFRYALRTFRKAPLFALVAVASMAFGIATNAAVFTLVDQVVLRSLPVARPGELVQLSSPDSESVGGNMGDGTELSYPMYRDIKEHTTVLHDMFCRMEQGVTVTYSGRSELVQGELVTGTFFPALGIQPVLGRLFTAAEDASPGGHPVAVLSFGYWQSRFGGARDVIGRTLSVNGHPYEIVGVVSAGFSGFDMGSPPQVYLPMTMQPKVGPQWLDLNTRRFRWVQVFGRLNDGVTRQQAQAALQPLYRSILERETTETAFASTSADTKRRFLEGALIVDEASQGRSTFRNSLSEPLLILMAVAAGVLLIVCANVANLLLARGAARHRELALRLAVGASRRQVIRLLLVESLTIAAAGAALGLVLATWGAQFLLDFYVTPDSSLALRAEPDARVMLFTVAVTVLTAMLAGIVPAFRSSRVELAPALKGAGGGVVAEQPTLRKSLVVAQVTLSFLMLCAAGLFVRSLQNLMAVDPGFTTSRVVTFSVNPALAGYDAERARAFSQTLLDTVRRTPGVMSAAYTFMPLLGGGGWGMGFTVEGYTPPSPDEPAGSMVNAVSPGYFSAMGISLLAGRDFDDRDEAVVKQGEGWPYRAAIVNQRFVDRYFGGVLPLGRTIGIGTEPGTPMPITIVGVVRDTRYTGIREEARAQVFVPYRQARMENITVYARTAGDPGAAMEAIRRQVAAIDPLVPIYEVSTLEDRVAESVVNERLIAALSTLLSTIATLLAVVGLYGVMAYTVTRRTREIGIRMALGALGRQVASAVLREAGVLVAIGLAFGLALSWFLGRYAESQLYGITPADPLTITAAATVLTVIATIAALVPARRASRVSPVTALRDE